MKRFMFWHRERCFERRVFVGALLLHEPDVWEHFRHLREVRIVKDVDTLDQPLS